MHDKNGDEITLVDAARLLGISWGRAWRLALIGVLGARKVGRSWMVSRASLERLATDADEAVLRDLGRLKRGP